MTPVAPEDLAMARRQAVDGKRIARIAEGNWAGKMDPGPIPWDKSAELARMVKDLAYHVTWLANRVEAMEKEADHD